MKVGVLTSSRADYGIYLPLLKKMKKDAFFSIEIIAFGTHLSKEHGYTVRDIEQDNYPTVHYISSLLSNDDEQSIVSSYGLTVLKFAAFWDKNKFDLVFCLGDRFEMNAAVQSGIPMNINFAHIHGGEITLGAIDNIYRHQLTLASKIHFTAAEEFKEKVIQLIGDSKNVYSIGALSLTDINLFKPIDKRTFYEKFEIPNEKFALVTFHPETIHPENNKQHVMEIKNALSELSKKIVIVITMPNADTNGSIFREGLLELQKVNPGRILLIENFGKTNYFSAMYYAQLLIGNTSSGILEAASFGKYVINVGNRQKGRLQSKNVLNANFDKSDICSKFDAAIIKGDFKGENIYYQEKSADKIIKIMKEVL